jgi:hypothetical protein
MPGKLAASPSAPGVNGQPRPANASKRGSNMITSFISGMLLGIIVCACCKVAGRPPKGKPVKTLG